MTQSIIPRAILMAVALGLLFRVSTFAAENDPAAFPGAEGFGAVTKGGRGGRVIQVNNLLAKGKGSLHAACAA